MTIEENAVTLEDTEAHGFRLPQVAYFVSTGHGRAHRGPEHQRDAFPGSAPTCRD